MSSRYPTTRNRMQIHGAIEAQGVSDSGIMITYSGDLPRQPLQGFRAEPAAC